MRFLSSKEIRKVFLEFFESKGHKVVESSSLVPSDDPTLLFTTAGMVQFKPYFLREKFPPFTRATSVQKCLRAGGKASDLENVGKTPRHHTFFEMLGNFSFGDYFKREAIKFAWEFVTEVVEIDKELLYVSIFRDDEESFEIWHKEIGLDSSRIIRLGEKDNFWGPPGSEGPCGPCSEIYIDLRDVWGYDKQKCKSPEDCDGFLEFWNLVFMQYHQDESGKRTELEFKGIDTGMGLERLAMILQNKKSVYETDVFEPTISRISEITGRRYEGENIVPFNILSDHTRAITFVASEGVYPSNEGRGYVLRRILRRALRYASKIGINEPIIYKVVDGVVKSLGDVYPEINSKVNVVKDVIKTEEERYYRTLGNAMKYLNELMFKLKEANFKVIPGEEVFKLYDSMGMPLDVIGDIALDENFTIEWDKFNELMDEQKRRGKMSWKGRTEIDFGVFSKGLLPTIYVGDEYHEYESRVISLYKRIGNNFERVETLSEGEEGILVIEETPFYGEGGGQVGDVGIVNNQNVFGVVFDTQKDNDVYFHFTRVERGNVNVGDKVLLKVDVERKKSIARNHTSTHILHASLRKVLGEHVVQSGSLVEARRLRFDFSHYSQLSPDDIKNVENEANRIILENLEVVKRKMSYKEALNYGALAFFGDKYGEVVRVVEIPGFSKELCGGTHVNRTGDIGVIKIIQEKSVASGIRRIEAISGEYALEYTRSMETLLKDISTMLGVGIEGTKDRISMILKKLKELEKEKTKVSVLDYDEIVSKAIDVGKYKLIFDILNNGDISQLSGMVDRLKESLENVIVFLGSKVEGGVNFVAGTNTEVDLVKLIRSLGDLGIRGGGRKDFVRGMIYNISGQSEIKKEIVKMLGSL